MAKDFFDLNNNSNHYRKNQKGKENLQKDFWLEPGHKYKQNQSKPATTNKKKRRLANIRDMKFGNSSSKSSRKPRNENIKPKEPGEVDSPSVYKSGNFVSAIPSNRSNKINRMGNPNSDRRSSGKLYGDSLYADRDLKNTPELVNRSYSRENVRKGNKKRKSKKNTILIMVTVVVITFFICFCFLLYSQSRVMQTSYQNANIQNQINNLDTDNLERRERISREADLNLVAKKAREFGFQVPKQKQIVEVKDEQTDQVTYFNQSNNASGISSESIDMQKIYNNLEEYILNKEKTETGEN